MHPGYTKETICHKLEDSEMILLSFQFKFSFAGSWDRLV